ncbi:MAG TPA: Ig-like domain-containing protein [Flavisolibacter sp.]|nr:Ig-like domain-containing protein [Flavisolibacter sp.]
MKLFYRLFFVVTILGTAFFVSKSNDALIFSAVKSEAVESKSGNIAEEKRATKWIDDNFKNIDTVPSSPNQPLAVTSVTAIKTVDKATAIAGDTLTYTVTIKNTGADVASGLAFNDVINVNTTLIPDSLRYSPLAFDDAYSSVGNVGISVPAADGVLFNDMKGFPLATLTAIASRSTINGGTVAMAADGSFTYNPAAGYTGTDTIRYIIQNRVKKDTGVIAIAVSAPVWFINNTYAGTITDGRLATPFKTIAAFQALNNGALNRPGAGQTVFIHESATAYDGNITLLNGQKLIGQDATTSIAAIAGIALPAYSLALPVLNSAGATVNLTTSAASTNAITLATSGTGYLVRGLSIGNKTGTGITGTNFGTLNVSETNISGTGQALSLTTGALTGSFGTLSSTSGAFGVSLATVSGTLTATTGALSGNTITGFSVNGSNGTITYPGAISGARPVDIQNRTGNTVTLSGNITSTNQGINITGNTGGTILFSGTSKSLTTTINTAVNLVNNAGTTINFLGGGLVISTTTGTGFNATGGAAAIQVGGTGNTIASTNNTALNVANSTIGAGGLVFQSISSNNASKGIAINTTGSVAGLTITGVGTTAGSGGTIQNITTRGIEIIGASFISLANMTLNNANTADNGVAGELDNLTCNAAVYLGAVNTASLNRVNITTTAQQGLNANNVTALTIDNSIFSANGTHNNASTGTEEGALKLKDLQGICNILNSTFTNSAYRIAHLINTTGNMNLHVTNSAFINTGTLSTIAQDCFEMRTRNTATATVVIAGSSFKRAGTKGVQIMAENSSTINLSINNCTVDRQGGLMAGIEVGSDHSGKMFANIDGNPVITASNEVALNIYASGTSASKTEATVRSNPSITGNGLGMYTDPTVQAFANMDAKAVVLIQGNTVTNSDDRAIFTRATEGSGTMNATVQNNSVTVPAVSFTGIEVIAGSDEMVTYSNINCSNVRLNTVVNNGVYAFFVQTASIGAKVQLQGNGANVPALWLSNSNSGSPADFFTSAGGQILISPAYVCLTPSNLVAPTSVRPPSGLDTTASVSATGDTISIEAVKASQSGRHAENPVASTVAPSSANKETVTLSGGTVNVSGINLPLAKTFVIEFETRVNTPFPVNVCSVSNQGTVAGSNFSTVSTDNDGNTGNGVNATITAVNSAPAITVCQTAITATSSTCTSSQTFAVTTTGCPTPTVTYTIQGPGTVITSPYAFPVGTTTVIANASNGIGANATCSFTVTVSGTNAAWTGVTNANWNTSTNWSCGVVPDIATNVTINGGAPNMPVLSTAGAANDITLGTGATLTVNNGNTLQVGGNFASTGTINANGTMHFTGSGVQSIPAATYNNMVISGGSNKNISGSVVINGVLSFTSGTLSLGNNALTLGAANTITGSSNTSYIVTNGSGALKKTGLNMASGNYTYPVGYSASSYTPVTLSNTGTMDNFSVRVINNVYSSYSGTTPVGSPIASGVINKTWFVTEDVANGSNISLTLQWNSADELPGFSRTSSYVSHNTNSAWLAGPAGAATGTDPYSRFRTNITSFSPFGVGTSGSLLPVQLLSFRGSQRANANLLEWGTANEQLQKFEVERSAPRNAFIKIGDVVARGRTAVTNYSITDDQPLQGVNFYRLKMIHVDGTVTYSSVISIARGSTAPTVTIYPSPVVDNRLTIQMTNVEKGKYGVSFYNAGGQLVYATSINHEGGSSAQMVELPATIAKGVYHLGVKKGGYQFNQNIIIQ